MNVRDVMTREPVVAAMAATVGEIVEIFQGLEFRHLPIVDGSDLVGIVSERDLRGLTVPLAIDEASIERYRARLAQPVTELMSSDVVSIDPESSLAEAVDLMLEMRVGALPVVEEGSRQLVGIVSYIDILREARDLLA
jgi:acetoin utilization protein AcuB